ncbi:MAG: hypothetical protein E6R03_17485 [Hyphomicrobiaceae bacterium]|nr:MAG: hypothetical protein E6R03_17485 [Hyphomicrobiaceae bacterium]
MGISFDVEKASSIDRINSAIIFGDYGMGKTWLGASASEIEDYSPTLIVDIEGSVAGVGRKYPNVDVVQADTFAKLEYIKQELLDNPKEYGAVIFDTLNVAQKRAKARFKEMYPNNTFAMWDALADWSMDFVRSMHHADFMSIFIAHPQTEKDDSTGRLTTTVKLAGGARSEVPTVPDLIGYTFYATNEDGSPVRALQVGRSANVVTKNRFGLPDVIYPSGNNLGVTIYDIQREIIKARLAEQE